MIRAQLRFQAACLLMLEGGCETPTRTQYNPGNPQITWNYPVDGAYYLFRNISRYNVNDSVRESIEIDSIAYLGVTDIGGKSHVERFDWYGSAILVSIDP